jgi:amino acid permease
MSSLTNLSAVSVVAMVFIVIIIIYLYVDNPGDSVREAGGTLYENWFEIRPGYLESLGTFVFTFVSQHTVHLTYESIQSDVKSLENWKIVSTVALSIATVVSLTVGVTVYCTFWQHAGSDLFEMYPPLGSIDFCKMLLCLTMLLTFPLPFFTCRELIIVSLTHQIGRSDFCETAPLDDELHVSLQEPLLNDGHAEEEEEGALERSNEGISSRILVEGQEKQLLLSYHLGVTILLWSITTLLAILAPSLGDVLDLVGCAAGTMIAFVLPGLFSFRLQGYTHLAALILAVGGIVGLIGTVFSLQKLITDM